MVWCRARKPEQIEQREAAILNAAKSLFAESDYGSISLNAIAREAGFAKSNVYRYFSSREEIFLRIYMDTLRDWSADVSKTYAEMTPGISARDFAEQWVEVVIKYKELLELSPLLYISMERNSSEEQLESFKLGVKEIFIQQGEGILRVFEEFDFEDIKQLLNYIHCLMAGLWPASNPNVSLCNVFNREELKDLKIEFKNEMTSGIELLIEGLKTRANTAPINGKTK